MNPISRLRSSLLLSLLFFLTQNAFSQSDKDSIPGSTIIHSDPNLDSLVQMSKRINYETQSVPGYRLQLYFGPDRKKANEIKSGFLQLHQEMSAYVIYQQPNYKVRIGNYLTRLEAYKVSRELFVEYPSAFIVKDDIALPMIE